MLFLKSRFQKKYYKLLENLIKDNLIYLKKTYNNYPWKKINAFSNLINKDIITDITVNDKSYTFEEAIKYLKTSKIELENGLSYNGYSNLLKKFLSDTDHLSDEDTVKEKYIKFKDELTSEFRDYKDKMLNCINIFKQINSKYREYAKNKKLI